MRCDYQERKLAHLSQHSEVVFINCCWTSESGLKLLLSPEGPAYMVLVPMMYRRIRRATCPPPTSVIHSVRDKHISSLAADYRRHTAVEY